MSVNWEKICHDPMKEY